MADKVIHVNVTATKSQKVNVSAGNVQNQITATPDSSQYYSNLAKNWAISDKLVNNEDYSAKKYANLAKQDAERANTFTNSCLETYNNVVDYSAEAIDNIVATKNSAISDISETGHKAVTDIESSKSAILGEIETTTEENKAEITTLADSRYQEIESLSDEIKENAQDIANRVSFAMFDPVTKDHVLTYEETKGLELQGTYVYKNAIAGSRYGYPDFYAKCVEEKSQATATSTTLGGTAITLYIHANGHTYYNIAQKSIVDTFYNSTGIAWFYGIDTANERIFLPRNDYFFQLTGDTSEVNKTVSAGLPNITGVIGDVDLSENRNTGAFVKNATHHVNNGIAGNSGRSAGSVKFDASLSNSIYGNSNTVQPPASKKLLYICVGNTESDISWIDVVTQVEGGVKDLEDKTNEGLSALANASNALRTTQITNCITEIPQRIKLELNNGVLTLKKGSKVIVPNGVGVFDEVVINSDINFTYTYAPSTDTPCMLFINKQGTQFVSSRTVVTCYSGTTQPTGNYRNWYNTTENKMYSIGANATVDGSGFSLPIAIITQGNGVTKSIDQVFNGFGYIGSTVWADKGVKGLIPNGRNEDGTLNNIEFTLSSIKTQYVTYSGYMAVNSSGIGIYGTAYTEYHEDKNLNYDAYAGNYIDRCEAGTVTYSGGRITSFNPKRPFRAVDYNDYINTPHITETYVSGTSGYRVYSDGYCEQWGYSAAGAPVTVTFLKAFKDTNYQILLGGTDPAPADGMASHCWSNKTTTSFGLWNRYGASATTSTCDWRACGYIA